MGTRALFGSIAMLAMCATRPAAQESAFRLVAAPAPKPAPLASNDWFSSFAEAAAAARQRQVHLLLFFTAKWCGPCKCMERDVFVDSAVQKELAGLALAHLDIDDAANLEVGRRYHGDDGVPAFVLLDGDGAELHRWVGATDAATFLGHLRSGTAEAVRAATGALDHHEALTEFYLQRRNLAQVEQQLAAIAALDPARKSPALEGALWSCCTAARQRGDWTGLRDAARSYLALPATPRAQQVEPLLGIAEFELTGVIPVDLQQYIDARIAVLVKPQPGSTAAERLAKLVGAAGPPSEQIRELWLDRNRAAMDELVAVGAAAGPSLRAALLDKPTGSWDAAIVLGRVRLPETPPWIVDQLDAPTTHAWAKPNLVFCLGMYKEQRWLPVLLRHLGDEHAPRVRANAVDGLRDLLFQTDGTTRQDIADALAHALESNDRRLCGWVLQAMFYVQAPLPLDLVLDTLGDERNGFGDIRLCDDALWILLQQLGLQLLGADGTAVGRCTPEVEAFLRQRYAERVDQLSWDPSARHYVVRTR
ncbi:MAG: thioredoxin family protein [Planctomycetota bacterium]